MQDPGAHRGCRRQRDDHGNEYGAREYERELAEQPADDAAHQEYRDEYGDERDADREHREANLGGSFQSGLQRSHAFFEMTRDVFHHNDCIVHDESACDGERHQGEIVEREAAQVHDCACPDQGDRNRHCRNERRVHIAQENEHDEHDQQDRDEQRSLDVADRGADGQRPVEHHDEVVTTRDRRLQSWESRFDRIDGLDDVGAGLTEDDQIDTGLTVEEPGLADCLLRIDDIGHIRQMNDAPVEVAHDQRFVVLRPRYLAVDDDVGSDLAVGQLSLGNIGVLSRDGACDGRQTDSVVVELGRIQLYPHGRVRRPHHGDLTDSADLGNTLSYDGRGLIVQGWYVIDVRLQAEDHDRGVRWVHFPIGRIRGKIRGQV